MDHRADLVKSMSCHIFYQDMALVADLFALIDLRAKDLENRYFISTISLEIL